MRRRDQETDIDADVSPQYRHQRKLVEESEKAKENFVAVETWYERRGDKILYFSKLKNGNKKSTLYCRMKHRDAIAQLKAKNIVIKGY